MSPRTLAPTARLAGPPRKLYTMYTIVHGDSHAQGRNQVGDHHRADHAVARQKARQIREDREAHQIAIDRDHLGGTYRLRAGIRRGHRRGHTFDRGRSRHSVGRSVSPLKGEVGETTGRQEADGGLIRIFSEEAEDDLDSIWSYIAEDDIAAADALLERFAHTVDILSLQPRMGRRRKSNRTRQFPVPGTPYAVIYRHDRTALYILRIMHGARKRSG